MTDSGRHRRQDRSPAEPGHPLGTSQGKRAVHGPASTGKPGVGSAAVAAALLFSGTRASKDHSKLKAEER